MRSLLTGGIKAILAIAALSTAAHWALRMNRDPVAAPAGLAAIPDPVATGSIVPRKVERPSSSATIAAEPMTKGLDQGHLLKLITGASNGAPAEKKPRNVLAKR